MANECSGSSLASLPELAQVCESPRNPTPDICNVSFAPKEEKIERNVE